uniref:Uncharacterized protein n=1 Tax=Oryza meridionalis TaxID=40149 RepID=A0A0E0CYG9_9ORYZ
MPALPRRLCCLLPWLWTPSSSSSAVATFSSAPSQGCPLHTALARRCAPAAASLALYSRICVASPPTPSTLSFLLAALALSSSPPPSPPAGFARLAAACLTHAQAFKYNALAHPVITPPDGAMELAGVCDDCAYARAVEVRRQEKYVVVGRRRPCRRRRGKGKVRAGAGPHRHQLPHQVLLLAGEED